MIQFTAVAAAAAAADAVAVGVRHGRRFDDFGASLFDRMPWLTGHLDDAEFVGKTGQVVVVPGGDSVPFRKVALIGLGEAPDHEQLRRGAGAAARALPKSAAVATSLHHVLPASAEAVGCGFALGAYSYTKHKSEPKPSALGSVLLIDAAADDVAAADTGGVIAAGVNLARDLVNEPAIGKAPAVLAERAVAIAAEVGLSVRVLDESQIVAERLGGLHGVSLGAANPLVDRARRPATRALLTAAATAYQEAAGDVDGRVRATLEVIWLAGWVPHESQQKPLRPGSAKVSLTDVLKKEP